MAFGEIFLEGHDGQSRAGKTAPSCPLGQPITAQDLIYLACSRGLSHIIIMKNVQPRTQENSWYPRLDCFLIQFPQNYIIYVKQCDKGKGSHEENGKKSLPSWPLFFILLSSSSTIHLEITGWGSYGCAYKHFASVPEHHYA